MKGNGNSRNCSTSNCSSNGGRTIIMSKTEAVTIAMSTAEVIEQIPATSAARRRPSRQKEIGTRQQGWCPKQSTSSNNWTTPSKFEAMSYELDDSKEEEDRKSHVVTCYDGETDCRTNEVHESQGGVLQLRNVNRLPELGAWHQLESA